MEPPLCPRKVPRNSGEFDGIPWISMDLYDIDINKFHISGNLYHCLLHDFMLLCIRESISG